MVLVCSLEHVGGFLQLERATGGAPVSSRRRFGRYSCSVWLLAGAQGRAEFAGGFGFTVGELHHWETEIPARPAVFSIDAALLWRVLTWQ